MIKQAYSVFDSKSETFTPPTYGITEAEVVRGFSDLLQQDNAMSRHPEDFTLFHIGEYEDDTAQFTSIPPRSVVTAISLKAALDNG